MHVCMSSTVTTGFIMLYVACCELLLKQYDPQQAVHKLLARALRFSVFSIDVMVLILSIRCSSVRCALCTTYYTMLYYATMLYRVAVQGEEACVVRSGSGCGARLLRGVLLAVTTMTVAAGTCTLTVHTVSRKLHAVCAIC
jgi:hypothetical protein